MTRLPADGGKRPPLRRVAAGSLEDLVLDLTERTVTIRPKRCRDPRALVRLTWSAIYQRGLVALAEERTRALKRRPR